LHRPHGNKPRDTILDEETPLERFATFRRGARRVVAAYPSPYRTGIANLGFHFLYKGLRQSPNLHIDRIFTDISPVTLETGSDLSSAAFILFSISYEEDFINVVRMLHEAGVPALRVTRAGRPLVIAGGPAVSANPIPLLDIVDAMALGEGEETLPEIVRELEETGRVEAARRRAGEPGMLLESLARIPGMLVPGFSHTGVSLREPLSPVQFPRSVIITPESAFPDTMLVESGRGCPGVCAFCLATSLYRPFRFMPLPAFEELVEDIHPAVRKIGLVSPAVAANPDFVPIVRLLASKGIGVSFSSLRAEDLDDEKAAAVGSVGTRSVALAPESGSERVRFALGKRVPDEVYFEAAAMLRAAGVTHFTLYLLVGGPGDDDRALAETKIFMERFKKSIGGRSFSVHVNPLVPKPWTPLQFWAMPEERELAARQRAIEKALRTLGVAVQLKSVRSALRQALFSTGDERIGRAIVHHVEGGLSWNRALEEAGVNAGFPHEKKGPETSFPWDEISGPVRRGTLFKRFEAMERGGAPEAP
jgi:radical SAM superfamily enzyme YgiQ (UPF0313 family)